MAYIDKNDIEASVKELQKMLRGYGLFAGEDTLVVAVNGVYGAETERAVSFFQRGVGLSPTGRADLATWTALVSAYDASRRTADGIIPIPRDAKGVLPGERSDAVSMLQLMLAELARYYEECRRVTLSGIYDGPTAYAVSAIRRKNGLSRSDILDTQIWNIIVSEYNSSVNENE